MNLEFVRSAKILRAIEAAERDAAQLSERWWVQLIISTKKLRHSPDTYVSLEYGPYLASGEPESSVATRFYYEDGTYYTSIRG